MNSRLKLLRQRAGDGDVVGQCELADWHMAREQFSGALPWIRKAARTGEPWAQYHLGLLYDHGKGVARDQRRAKYWYKKAADAGYASAQLNLGILLARSKPRPEYAKALHLYRLAAAQGRRNAIYNLALYYALGRGVRRDTNRAKQLFRKAALAGDRTAKSQLARLAKGLDIRVIT